jgi:hypothetical protein
MCHHVTYLQPLASDARQLHAVCTDAKYIGIDKFKILKLPQGEMLRPARSSSIIRMHESLTGLHGLTTQVTASSFPNLITVTLTVHQAAANKTVMSVRSPHIFLGGFDWFYFFTPYYERDTGTMYILPQHDFIPLLCIKIFMYV